MASPSSTERSNAELDVLVVGAGFSGTYFLYAARKAGFSVKLYEAGSNFGGVWHWNCYPGARTDSDYNIYQYSLEEVWKDWSWKERFASQSEIVDYFEYVDKKLDLSRDILFNTSVAAARFDSSTDRWIVSTNTGVTSQPRFVIMCTGYGYKPSYPNLIGFEKFKGISTHTSRWPREGIETAGKRIGVIGTGASGIQIIQECGPQASHLTVFQRTLNTALPMAQRALDEASQDKMKTDVYPALFRTRLQTFGGTDFDFIYDSMFDLTPEELQLKMEELWEEGSFRFWLGNFAGIFFDQKANDVVYKFWRQKVLPRINDPELQKKLAPEVALYPLGCKRPSLEQAYYEVYNLPHVDLVDLRSNPIAEATEKGLKTQDGIEHELDVLIFATGFDAVTGSLTSVDIQGPTGESLGDKWKNKGLSTYLGLASHGYPNMFFVYGPQGPTGFCTGPTCAEVQGDWVVECLQYMRDKKQTRIEATKEAEDEYTKLVNDTFDMGLWKDVNSWWNGGNIPGKRRESLNFTGGLPTHTKLCRDSAANGYAGFSLR